MFDWILNTPLFHEIAVSLHLLFSPILLSFKIADYNEKLVVSIPTSHRSVFQAFIILCILKMNLLACTFQRFCYKFK